MKDEGKREFPHWEDSRGREDVIALPRGCKAPPLGAVVTGYLIADNEVAGYIYEPRGDEEPVEIGMSEARLKRPCDHDERL